jgi:hypothetical protein
MGDDCTGRGGGEGVVLLTEIGVASGKKKDIRRAMRGTKKA